MRKIPRLALIGILLSCPHPPAQANPICPFDPRYGSDQHNNSSTQGDQPKIQDLRQGTIKSLTQRLESDHFAPRKIDDTYSADVWNKFLADLDKDRNIFLASDIQNFQQFKTDIDDEMHASSTRFFDTVLSVYHKRTVEAMAIYHELLQTQMEFHSERTITEDRSKAAWPKDEAERKEIWADRVRLNILKKILQPRIATTTKLNRSELKKASPAAATRVRKWLDNTYKYIISPEGEDQLFSVYINAMTACMDPHSTYFAPVDARTMNEQLSNHFFGLGLELSGTEGVITVQSLRPGGSALRSGLVKPLDRITAVSDKDDHMVDVSAIPVLEVTKMLRGEKGSTVRLQIERNGEPSRIITLERTEINQTDAAARAVIIEMNGKKTGYISLPMFYVDPQNPQGAHCSADVYKLLLRLKEAKIDDLVIDLRDNPGGSLDEVASMASLFIDKGPVVQLKNKENIQTYSKNEGTAIYSGPMAVLVNGNSASASEIFAAAMQDYKRAVIIGCNTYGKGTAQENLVMGKVADRIHNRPAMNFGAMRLSIKKIYRVTGSSTQVKGVTPDLMLPDPLDYTYVRETNMPFAMPWDTVAASPFKTWDTVCSPAILQKAREQVGRDSAFAIIHENTEWLKQNLKGPYSLEPEKLAEQMKAVDNHVARINEAKKMAPSDNITIQDPPPAKDNEKDGAASAVVAAKDGAANDPIKYNKWLDQIKSDIYIHQAISVINEMINKSK